MKNLLLISVFMILSIFLFGQSSIELIDHDDNAIINGQNLEIIVEDLNIFEAVSPEIYAINVSSTNIEVKIRAEEIQVVEGSNHYFCGLGNCFPPGTMETPNPYLIEAGSTIGEDGFFSSHYMPGGMAGTTIIRYTYYNIADLNDTISFTVTFNGSPMLENSLQLFDHEDMEIFNGDNLEVSFEDLNIFEAVSSELFAKNNSATDISIKIRAEEIQVVAETSHYFCGLGNCFPPGTMETPNPYTIPAGQMIGEDGFFSSHYMPMGQAGTTIIRYTYFNVENLNDTLSFTVTFIGEAAPVDPVFQLFDHDNTEYVNGAEIEVRVEDLNAIETVSPELFLKNNSDSDRSIRCKREVMEEVTGTLNYFCAFGNCLSPEFDETSREFILAPGEVGDEASFFSAHYIANGMTGDSKFKYTFFDINNVEDEISVVVAFTDVTAIQDIEAGIQMNAYPNPATHMVQIDLSDHGIKHAQLVIYNTLGTIVYSQAVNNNSVQIDLSDFVKGVYLYRLEGAVASSKTAKLVVK